MSPSHVGNEYIRRHVSVGHRKAASHRPGRGEHGRGGYHGRGRFVQLHGDVVVGLHTFRLRLPDNPDIHVMVGVGEEHGHDCEDDDCHVHQTGEE